MPHGFKKKTTKRKRNPNEMPLNTKSLFFCVYSDFKTETAEKNPKTFEYTTRADSDIRRICRWSGAEIEDRTKLSRFGLGRQHTVSVNQSLKLYLYVYTEGLMSMRNKQCIIRLKPRVSLKNVRPPLSLASNKKGRVETIQHQQTKKTARNFSRTNGSLTWIAEERWRRGRIY